MNVNDDILRRLRDADPAPDGMVRGAARSPRARQTLDEILGQPREEARRRAPRPKLGIAAALVAAGLLVFSLVVVDRSEDLLEQRAGVVLSEAATTAARGVGLDLDPGEYLYDRSRRVATVTFVTGEEMGTALVPRVREVWLAADGSGRIREKAGEVTFPSERDRSVWVEAGSPPIRTPSSDRTVPPGRLFSADGQRLPTEPEALARSLLERTRSKLSKPEALFVAAADLLTDPATAPEIRSALYRVVGRIDGVELLGEVTDPTGRLGIGVALTSRSSGALQRRVLTFDPATSRVLAIETVLLERAEWIHADPPVTISSHVFDASEVVSSLQARPSTR